mmetsp:Transcript_15659/g.33813  ORF Transcript_15659/g.33813 Transcript_15659/m.33813 type:complete len:264 (-) Transcript_15659:355-1146(-)
MPPLQSPTSWPSSSSSSSSSLSSSSLAMASKGSLRIFLDTADCDQWRRWLPSGVFYGITTNPTLLHRAKLPANLDSAKLLYNTACELHAQELQLQALGTSPSAIIKSSLQLHSLQQQQHTTRIVLKLPCTEAGLTAAGELVRAHNVPVTMTGVYAAHQALLAMAVGAEYAAPYLGRMCDSGVDGFAEIELMGACVASAQSAMRVLVASIRSTTDLTRLAAAPTARGKLDTFTISPAVASMLINVNDTIAAAEQFEQDARESLL